MVNIVVPHTTFDLTGKKNLVDTNDNYYFVDDDHTEYLFSDDANEQVYKAFDETQFGLFELTGYLPSIQTGVNLSVPNTLFESELYDPLVFQGPVNRIEVETTARFELIAYLPEVITGVGIAVPFTTFEILHGVNYYKLQTITCTGDPVPIEHIQDSKELEADAYVDLFEIILSDKVTKIYLKKDKDVDWQGHTYEGTGIKIEGVGTYADDEVARPKLTLFNPEGVFSSIVNQGLLDNATVVRIRVLKQHIIDDVPVYRRSQWRVSRVGSMVKPTIGLELRDMLDGQNFQTPGRMFIPPDFPTVSLQ